MAQLNGRCDRPVAAIEDGGFRDSALQPLGLSHKILPMPRSSEGACPMARLRITAVVTVVLLSVVSARAELQISPAVISLDRPEGSQQILVTEVEGDRRRDVTREARYEIAAPAIARIAADGLLRPVTEGTTQLTVKFGDKTLNVPITVSGLQKPVPVSFSYEVLPLLTKGRCNAGGCHGKAEGQNGFKLSLFGFDAAADHDAIFKEAKGRRLTLTNPAASLMLLKGTATMPHGGGRKIEPNSPAEHRLRRWIAEGAEFVIPPSDGKPVERQVVGIEVEPAQVVIAANGTQQLRVTAIDDAGGKAAVRRSRPITSRTPRTSPTSTRVDSCKPATYRARPRFSCDISATSPCAEP